MKDGTWFVLDGVAMQWLARSPAERVSRCDRCSRKVGVNERRLRMDDHLGPRRAGGKGKRHTYLCEGCGVEVAG